MQIEEVGHGEEDDADYENKLQQFIDYIQRRKVVMLEDVAAEFKLQTKDVVSRIESLEAQGRLLGITDDRGKFIHITEDEYAKIAGYLQRKGRVNRSELQKEVNRIVRMMPTEADKEMIKNEQLEVLNKVEANIKADQK